MSNELPSETTVLHLIRHGATAANERIPFILQGNSLDLPLSPAGERQATAVANLLAGFPVTRVYSSIMLRARQTAATIAARHRLDAEPLEHLHECNVGVWEGMDWESIRQQYPEAHRKFVDNPAEHPNLGGESYGDVFSRARPVLDGLLLRHAGECIVVVAHNVVNRVYLAHLLGIGLQHAPSIRQENGGANLIHSVRGQTAVVTLNSGFHLREP